MIIDYLEWRVLYCTCADKGDNDSDNIHRQLELEELGDTVVHVASPHNSLHDAGEVVIGQDNIGGLFGHVSAGDTLDKDQMIITLITFIIRIQLGYSPLQSRRRPS